MKRKPRHHQVSLTESVHQISELPKASHPERRPGLERALKLIEYLRGTPGGPLLPGAVAALDRMEGAIKAELENGGPLTTPLMDTDQDD